MPSDTERRQEGQAESKGNGRSRRAQEVVAELESQMKREEASADIADIAAASSDVEKAAEEMGAPSSEGESATETAAAVSADEEIGELPEAGAPFQRIAAHLATGWPPVTPRRSKQEEAEAFFAFTQRLAQRMAEEAAAPPEEAAAPESVSPPEEPKEQVDEESTPE